MSRFLLACAPIVGQAMPADFTDSDYPPTTAASTSMVYGETPTCYKDCMALHDTYEGIHKAQNTKPERSHQRRLQGRPPVRVRRTPDIEPSVDLFPPNVKLATNYLFTNTMPRGLPVPVTKTLSSDETYSVTGSLMIPIITQTQFVTVVDSSTTEISMESTITLTSKKPASSTSETHSSKSETSKQLTSSTTSSAITTTTTTAVAPTSTSPVSSSPLSQGAIAGIVVGVLSLFLAIVIAFIVYRRRKKLTQEQQRQPFDKQLIGYPYPVPQLSLNFSRALAPNSSGVLQGGQVTGDTTSDEGHVVGGVRDVSQDRVPVLGESDGLGGGYQQNQSSRDTIRDILSAYSSTSCYSQDGGGRVNGEFAGSAR
ncbi:hypothetical protein B0T10DRAFT_252274 [Thelonectria olida]|uniref:Mid2 domain-containing protein n=1 Tax=Thelonectria olida TaxID=1576542 RepID=A0A9P8WAX7_9HYPO|nr:hypothetical protein B0T10DRAFT_252274 [Thelonectria olida]